jgi:hypothetical protein
MNDSFEIRLRASVRAGWWTLLIGVVFLAIQWIAYLLMTSARPSWPMIFWGKGMSWETVQMVWFWGAAAFKYFLWILALMVIWLTLWSKQVKK